MPKFQHACAVLVALVFLWAQMALSAPPSTSSPPFENTQNALPETEEDNSQQEPPIVAAAQFRDQEVRTQSPDDFMEDGQPIVVPTSGKASVVVDHGAAHGDMSVNDLQSKDGVDMPPEVNDFVVYFYDRNSHDNEMVQEGSKADAGRVKRSGDQYLVGGLAHAIGQNGGHGGSSSGGYGGSSYGGSGFGGSGFGGSGYGGSSNGGTGHSNGGSGHGGSSYGGIGQSYGGSGYGGSSYGGYGQSNGGSGYGASSYGGNGQSYGGSGYGGSGYGGSYGGGYGGGHGSSYGGSQGGLGGLGGLVGNGGGHSYGKGIHLPSQVSYGHAYAKSPLISFVKGFKPGKTYVDKGHVIRNYFRHGTYNVALQHYKLIPTVKVVPYTTYKKIGVGQKVEAKYRYKAVICKYCYHGYPKIDVYEMKKPYSYAVRRFVYLPNEYNLNGNGAGQGYGNGGQGYGNGGQGGQDYGYGGQSYGNYGGQSYGNYGGQSYGNGGSGYGGSSYGGSGYGGSGYGGSGYGGYGSGSGSGSYGNGGSFGGQGGGKAKVTYHDYYPEGNGGHGSGNGGSGGNYGGYH